MNLKNLKRLLLASLLNLLIITNGKAAIDPHIDYLVSHSKHFSIYHTKQQSAVAQQVADYAEAVYPKLQKKLNWTPTATTHIVLDDGNDFSNGFANVIHQNHITLFLTPPLTINTLENTNNFLYSLIEHELTHTFHLEKNKGLPALLNKIIGRSLFSYPNFFTPSWVIEGLATHYETHHKQQVGRGASSVYDALFRDEYLNGFKPFDQISLNIRTLPAGTTRYLYGVFFIEYLARTYGEEKITQWVESYSDNIIPFQIHSNAKTVFDKNLFALYDDFIKERSAFYKNQIQRLKQTALSKTTRLSSTPIEPNFVVNKTQIFAMKKDYSSADQLIQIFENQKSKSLLALRGNAILNQATQSNIIITKLQKCNEYTSLYDIYRYNIKNKTLKQITHCGRYPYAIELKNQQLIAVQLKNGHTRLKRLTPNGNILSEIKHVDANTRFGKMALNPDGQSIAINTFHKSTGWQIETYHLTTGLWTTAVDNNHSNFFPAFTADNKILSSSNKNGIYNIYKNKQAQSHLLLGGLNPQEYKDEIIFSSFKGGKYYLTKLLNSSYFVANKDVGTQNSRSIMRADPLPITTAVYLSSTNSISSTNKAFTRKFYPFKAVKQTQLSAPQPYSAIQTLAPYAWFPTFTSGTGLSQIGLTVNGIDVLERHAYSATMQYDTKYQKLSGNLQYQLQHNWSFFLQRQFGEILVSNNTYLRKQDSFSVNYSLPKTRVDTASNWYLGTSYSQDSDEVKATSAPSLITINSKSIGVGYINSNAQNYLLSYNATEGQTFRSTVEYAKESYLNKPTIKIGLDWRHHFALKNQQVLATRFVIAGSETNNNVYSLGGNTSSRNLSLFSGSITEPLFNKTSFPLRGYANTGFGYAVAVASLEWRLPINRPESAIKILPVGVLQNHYNVFVDVGTLFNNGVANNVKTGIGAELINKVAIFYHVEMSLRTGIAYGLNNGGGSRFYFTLQQQY